MDYKRSDKPVQPRWLGVDIRGQILWACTACNKVIGDKTEKCPCCGQVFTYEEGDVE